MLRLEYVPSDHANVSTSIQLNHSLNQVLIMDNSSLLSSASFQTAKHLLATTRIAEHVQVDTSARRPPALVTLTQDALVSEALQVGIVRNLQPVHSAINRYCLTTASSLRPCCKTVWNSLASSTPTTYCGGSSSTSTQSSSKRCAKHRLKTLAPCCRSGVRAAARKPFAHGAPNHWPRVPQAACDQVHARCARGNRMVGIGGWCFLVC